MKVKIRPVISIIFLLFLSVLFSGRLLIQKSKAAALTETSVMLYRVGASVTNSTSDPILVVFKPASTATEAKVRVTMPTSNAFAVSSTASDHTATTSGIPSTYQGEALTAVVTLSSPASAVSGGNVTFSTGDLTPGTLYGFFWTGGITNPASGNAGTHLITVATLTSADAVIDSNQVAVDTVGTNGDQVVVTATVPPAFNFALSGNTISLGTLSTSARTTGNVTVDIDTNSNSGWIAWIRSQGGAATLASSTTGDSISSTNTGSCVTASIGSDGYVVDVNGSQGGNSTGSLTIASEYGCTDSQAGGVISTTYEQIAQSTGQADSDTLTLTAVVTISAVTEAASDYTDTWEVVGAANF